MADINLSDPSKFLFGSEEHVDYWRKLLAIDAWFGVDSLKGINRVHMETLATLLIRAESEGKFVFRQALQWKRSIQTVGGGEQMRWRIDKEMEHRDVSWKVGAMFIFQMDVSYTKLTMNGQGKDRWGDVREFLIFELRPFGIEDLAGLDQESVEASNRN